MTKKLSIIKISILSVLVISGLNFFQHVDAQGLRNPIGSLNFAQFLAKIAQWIAGIAVYAAVLMIVIGGIMFILSGGNQSKVSSAQRTIYWAAIGLLIALLSKTLLNTLLDFLDAEPVSQLIKNMLL